MEQLRIIHLINEATNEERISFTEDAAAPADDFVPHGFKLQSDTLVDIDLPSAFPSEHTFSNKW